MRFARFVPFARALCAVLIVAGLVWGGYYVYEKGFGRRWRGLLVHEFKRFGLVINVRRLTLDPFRGLVAQDVEIFQDAAMDNLLAQVSNLSLDINYAALFQREPALNAVDLRNAQLSIPLPNGSNPLRLHAENVQARIYFVPGRLEIRQLSGIVLGIRCTASGTLINPASFSGFEPERQVKLENNGRFLTGIIAEIERLRPESGAMQLHFTFQGDMADLASLRIQDGSLQARQVDRLGYRLENLNAEFKLEQQRLDIRRLRVRDSKGEASASGSWDFVSGNKAFEIRSSLDLATLLGRDPRCPWARDWSFQRGPQVEMAGQVRIDGHVRYLGSVACDQFAYRGIAFQSLRANFSKDGTAWMVTDAEVGHRTGTLAGEGLRRAGEFRIRLQSGMDPQAFAPLLPAAARERLSELEFQSSPVLRLDLHGPDPRWEHLSGNGQVWLGRTRFRGVPVDSGSARFQLRTGVIDFEEARVAREDGECFGAFSYDLKKRVLQIKALEATVAPTALAAWLAPGLTRYLEGFKFKQNPTVVAETGSMPPAGVDQTGAWRVRISAQTPFRYRLLGQELRFDSARASITGRPGGSVNVHFDGRLGGGTWVTDLQIAPDSELQRSTVRLAGILLGESGLGAGSPSESSGLLSGMLDVTSGPDGVPAFQADFALHEARLDRSPPLRAFLPQLRRLGFGDVADVEFKAGSGQLALQVSRLRFASGPHHLDLQGSVRIPGLTLDLAGACDERTAVHVTGSLTDPEWEIAPPGQDSAP